MEAKTTNLICYSQNTGAYAEVPLPLWDVPCRIFEIAGAPLKLISWLFNRLTGNVTTLPEPPSATGHSLLGCYPELRERNFDVIRFLTDYHEMYGKEHGISKVKFGPKTFYIVSDPGLMKDILQCPKSFVRGDSLRVWRKFSPGGLSEGTVSQENRRQASDAIGEAKLPYYFPGMVTTADSWLQSLKPFSNGSNESFDLFHAAERFSLATIGETLFKDPESQESVNPFGLTKEYEGRCDRFIKAFNTLFEIISIRLASGVNHIPYFGETIYSFLYSKEEEVFQEAKNTLKEILKPIFKDILQGKIEEDSHFHKLIKVFQINQQSPDYDLILDRSLGFLQAAFETTSKALGWTLYQLASQQDLQVRLRKELEASEKLMKDPLTAEDLSDVPLLSQVMEEALRLFPPFPFLIRDIKKPNDFKKWNVDEGGIFILSPLLTNRNPKAWEDPLEFKPERFNISETAEEKMISDKWQVKNPQYSTFFGGIHRCPGRFFGKQELLVVLAKFLLRYQIFLDNPTESVELKFSVTLQPKSPVKVKIRAAR